MTTPVRQSYFLWAPGVILTILCGLVLFAAPNRNVPRCVELGSDVTSIYLGENSSTLIAGRSDGKIEQLDLETLEHRNIFEFGRGRVNHISASADGQTISCVVANERIVIRDVQTSSIVDEIELQNITLAALSPDGSHLAAGDVDGNTWVTMLPHESWTLLSPAHLKLVTTIQWNAAGTLLATGSQGGTIQVWDAESLDMVFSAAEPHSTILALGFEEDDGHRWIQSLHFDQTVTTFDLSIGEKRNQVRGSTQTRNGRYSTDGKEYVTIGRRGRVTLWDASSHESQVFQYAGESFTRSAVTAKWIVAAGAGSKVAVWRRESYDAPKFGELLGGLFVAGLILTCVATLHDWRKGLLYCVVLDSLRDPVRKLIPDAPVWFTLVMGLLWLVILLRAALEIWEKVSKRQSELWTRIWGVGALIVMFVATWRAISSYESGWHLALLGWSSYLAPVAGVLIGLTFVRGQRDLRALAMTVVGTSLVMSSSAFPELLSWDWRGLGGIEFDWIRYQKFGLISLMCGFYRSPTVLGLHAASAMMYAALLARVDSRPLRRVWLLICLLMIPALIFSGRRKMLLIVLVFVVVLAVTSLRRMMSHAWPKRRRMLLTATLLLL
ncbi:MAG: WD40 repeat domain-containing protein, partial [Planctomycetaceae bacterium]|nr:WD40 repeat domain-containing protein [Planctomycetaceae bacterium]